MFSKTCEYAIRALIYIARNAKGNSRVGIKAIAEGIESPVHFIAKILQDLSKQGFISSSKGPNGGFYLNKGTLDKSIADFVMAIDGDKIFVNCGLGLRHCSEVNPCPIHHKYKLIKEEITNMLQKAKLADFQDHIGKDGLITYLVTHKTSN